MIQKPSTAFIGAFWVALGAGFIGYILGLWRADMQLNEKGYCFTVIMFGLFAVISLQKSVRDRLERLASNRYLLWHLLVYHHPINRIISSRFVERNHTTKRKRLLRICISIKLVWCHYRSKKHER